VGVEVGLQGDARQHLGGGPVDQPEPVVAGQADQAVKSSRLTPSFSHCIAVGMVIARIHSNSSRS
jgi:hypothetical protein